MRNRTADLLLTMETLYRLELIGASDEDITRSRADRPNCFPPPLPEGNPGALSPTGTCATRTSSVRLFAAFLEAARPPSVLNPTLRDLESATSPDEPSGARCPTARRSPRPRRTWRRLRAGRLGTVSAERRPAHRRQWGRRAGGGRIEVACTPASRRTGRAWTFRLPAARSRGRAASRASGDTAPRRTATAGPVRRGRRPAPGSEATPPAARAMGPPRCAPTCGSANGGGSAGRSQRQARRSLMGLSRTQAVAMPRLLTALVGLMGSRRQDARRWAPP